MAKIGKGHYRWDQHWGDYDIFYSSKDKEFYTDAAKLFEGATEFFDSLVDSKTVTDEQKEIHMSRYFSGRQTGMRKIYALTQKELENSVNKFNRMFCECETKESKVILYRFEYKTESQVTESKGFRSGELGDNEFSMGFKYRIANKKTLGPNNIYTDIRYENRKYDRYDIAEMKEIVWSQELEDFIKLFSKSFDGLIDKMKPFFETEGKIMELIGKNILSQ